MSQRWALGEAVTSLVLKVAVLATSSALAHAPSAVVFENVAGMTGRRGVRGKRDVAAHPDWQLAKRQMLEGGYSSETVLMNAMYLGVPQDRERAFVVFTKDGASSTLRRDYELARSARPCTMDSTAHFRQVATRWPAYFVYQRYSGRPRSKPWNSTHECLRRNSGSGYPDTEAKRRRYQPLRASQSAPGRAARRGDHAPIARTRQLSVADVKVVAGLPRGFKLPAGRKAAIAAMGNAVVPAMSRLALGSIKFAQPEPEPAPRGRAEAQSGRPAHAVDRSRRFMEAAAARTARVRLLGRARAPDLATDASTLVGELGWERGITDSVLIGPGTLDPLITSGGDEMETRRQMLAVSRMDSAQQSVFAASAAARIGEKATEQARQELIPVWSPSRALPARHILEQRGERAGMSGSGGEATHMAKVLRTGYKNLAHRLQGTVREDGTLANLWRERWWREQDDRLPPLASDTAGMMRWDPGRHDVVDDALPTVDVPVALNVGAFMDMHVATCAVCEAFEARHGRAESPGMMCPACPDNIALVAHRLRAGYAPPLVGRLQPMQEDNRNSVGKYYHGSVKAMEKMDTMGFVLTDGAEARFDRPKRVVSLLAAVREKHEWAATMAGWKPGWEEHHPKTRLATDYTAPGINEAMLRWPYRLDGCDEAVKLLKPGAYMVCLDLKAYFNFLPWTDAFSREYGWIRDPRRDGGKWQFQGKPPHRGWPHPQAHLPPYRRFRTCSFGLAPVPAWASCVSGHLAKILKSKGVTGITFYVDDFLIVCDTKEEALRQVAIFVAVMRQLGLAVAEDKMEEPSQQCVYLGLLLDTVKMEVTITAERAAAIIADINGFLVAGHGSKKKLHSLQGKLSYCGMIVRGGRIYLRSIIDAVSRHRGQRGGTRISVEGELREDLVWWRDRLSDLEAAGSRMWLKEADFTVLTAKSDSSGRLGWGMVWGDALYWSKWTADEAMDPDMVYKELVPVVFLAEAMGEQLAGRVVRVGIDNSGAVFDLLKGTSPTPRVRSLLKRLANAQARHNFDIVGVQCDREQQKLADMLTRFAELSGLEAALPHGWSLGGADGSGEVAWPRRSLWRLSEGSNSVLRLTPQCTPGAL